MNNIVFSAVPGGRGRGRGEGGAQEHIVCLIVFFFYIFCIYFEFSLVLIGLFLDSPRVSEIGTLKVRKPKG